jgi:molybdenum cofactor cytidylyltransferase
VPAAGRSERVGSAKLLVRWHERELLGHVLVTLGAARAAGLLQDTIVVHRPEDDAVRSLAIDYRCYPVASRGSQGDLSDSLRAGIELLRGWEGGLTPAALLICLGDQPLLRLDVIRALIDAWRGGGISAVRPSYREAPGEPGHPLLLDRSLWPFASEMRGESGLAPVLLRRGIGIRTVSVAGRNPDVDRPEDLSALENETSAAPP